MDWPRGLFVCVALAYGPALIAQTVRGTLSNAMTHDPIAGASVVLQKLHGKGNAATTDASGSFRLANVEPGDYFIVALRPGFEPSAILSNRVHIEAGVDAEPVYLTLMPWPTLSGRVLNPDRQPIAGIPVTAVAAHGLTVPPVNTDKDGRYTFKTLPPGEYTVLANPLAAGKREFAPTYFPNAPERAGGQRVAAPPGADLAGYDIVLRGGPFFRVSGRVVDESGRPAAGATVELLTADASYAKTVADAEGAFAMEQVPPVDGRLIAQWKHGAVELRGFGALPVARHDVENVTLRLSPPVQVRGTVEFDGEPAGPVPGIYTMLEPVDGAGKRVSSRTENDQFRFDEAYPGRYRLLFVTSPAPGGYLDSVWLGDGDITLREFDVAPGMLPLRVVLRGDGGKVRGTLGQMDGGSDGMVVLLPQDERFRVQPFIRNGLFKSGGQFEISNVRPGDYYAVALQGGFRLDDFQDPAVVARLLPQAVAVHVEKGGTVSLTLSWQNARPH